MANLKGSTFEKQVENALARLNAKGTKRWGKDSHKTHSNALETKRQMYLKDFAKFTENKGLQGKLNTHFTPQNLQEFLNERLSNLSPKTALDYSSGFNSMLRGLEQTRVLISKETYNTLNEYVKDYRNEFNAVKGGFETGRAIQDSNSFINNLQEVSQSVSTIAELQIKTGLRVSEALEVTKNFNSYYNPTKMGLEGIIGKGGQEYFVKKIDVDLAYKLQNLINIPSYSSYYQNLKELGHKPHDLRITYAKNKYELLKNKGYTHKQALQTVSRELNHHRESITIYYLKRV